MTVANLCPANFQVGTVGFAFDNAKLKLECNAQHLYESFEHALIDFGDSLSGLKDTHNVSPEEYRLILRCAADLKKSVQDHGLRDPCLGLSLDLRVSSKSLSDALAGVRKRPWSDREEINETKKQVQRVLEAAKSYTQHIGENNMLALNHKIGDREFLDNLAQVGRTPEWVHDFELPF